MPLIMRQTEDKDWFQLDIGEPFSRLEIHRGNLPTYCTPELIAALAESKEIECIIISKQLLREYDLAWLSLEVKRREE